MGVCEVILQFGQATPSVVEHIVVILCLAVRYLRERCQEIFLVVLDTDYARHASDFLLEVLSSPQTVSIKAFVVEQSSGGKKKVDTILKYTYEIMTNSLSTEAQEHLSLFAQRKEGREDKGNEDSARNIFSASAIYLLSVSVNNL